MTVLSVGSKLSERYLQDNKPAAIPGPQDDGSVDIIALRTFLQEGDPLNGALAGPPRIILGFMEIKNARKTTDKIDGYGQLAAGSLGTLAGVIGLGGSVASIAAHIGMHQTATQIATITAPLGGSVVAGYMGGTAALIKGGLDLWRGLRHHDRKGAMVGGLKLFSGSLMIAGAACFPPLMAAGAGLYLTTATMANRKLMTKTELGAAAATIVGVASANPFLVIGGTAAFVGATAHHNRKILKMMFNTLRHPRTPPPAPPQNRSLAA